MVRGERTPGQNGYRLGHQGALLGLALVEDGLDVLRLGPLVVPGLRERRGREGPAAWLAVVVEEPFYVWELPAGGLPCGHG